MTVDDPKKNEQRVRVIHELSLRALRILPPETAHHAALEALKRGWTPKCAANRQPSLYGRIAGLDLPNPIGLAAGFDKDALAPDALLAAGFGFVECGTVTPLPQAGNAKPRLFRLNEDRAIINRMGFNNAGLDAFAGRLAARGRRPGVVGANVGANKDSADRAADYVAGMRRVWPYAAYVTVNVSSPNTPGLRGLQERGALDDLLGGLDAARGQLTAAHGTRPIFLKVAPDLDERAIRDIAELARNWRLDGLIVSNTTISRPDSLRSPAKAQTGGLSGRPLFDPSTFMLRSFAEAVQGELALIGAGGVESGRTALAKIKAGASAVQLYSALTYRGLGLVGEIADDLAMRLRAEGFGSVADAVGADLR